MGKLFEKACKYAIDCHSNQKRKDGTIYILHPFEVAVVASTMTDDEEVLATAILHDTIEDTDSEIDEIKELFGERIGKYVEYETEEKYPNLTKEESWILRKKDSLEKLKSISDINFKILYLSDKLANIRSLYRDYSRNGISAFDKFNVKDINIQANYYYEVLNLLKDLEEYEAYEEFKNKIDFIFNNKETK